jgi:hypothetical protein
MSSRRAISILPLVFAACDGDLDQFTIGLDASTSDASSGAPDGGSPLDSGIAFRFAPVDILFVVDDSGSMAEEQRKLAENFHSFAEQVIGLVDYRIAIVTTDMDSPDGERAGLVSIEHSSSAPYAIRGGLNLSACTTIGVEHGCFRGDALARPIIDSRQMDRETQIATFAQNVRVGTCGAGTEKGLAAMIRALEQTAPGGCNEGFLRPEANLLVIFVTDEEDDSPNSVNEYADAIEMFKPWFHVRMAVIGGAVGGEPSRCGPGGTAECGSICQSAPPPSSMTSCVPFAGAVCPEHEFCQPEMAGNGGVCTNLDARFWQYCYWCSYYNAPDCCSALPSRRYVELAREVERRVAAVRSEFTVRNCQGLGTRVSCLIDPICQDNFGDTLARIARELVLVDP